MRLPLAFALAAGLAACSHNDAELRSEHAQARQFRDAYETQAQEMAALKARVAALEATLARGGCSSPAAGAQP
jgi:hypothetical protein